MANILTQQLDRLTPAERAELERLAANAGMTVAEWIEFSQKAQIYHNAQEILTGRKAA
jgi:hypothetical protein